MSSLTTTTSMEESLEEFDTRLCLGIGGGSRPPVRLDELFPPPQEYGGHGRGHQEPVRSSRNKGSTTARGCASATARRNKKARTRGGDDGDRRSPRDGGDAADGARKKLRLTEEQAALLEDSFRAHNILSHGEKHDLAGRLGLSARQVEVWFQNRRARTKLKQTEMDFELLRRWCERLCDDNARLRRELAEARSSSTATRLTMVNNAACPSCNKLALVAGGQTAP